MKILGIDSSGLVASAAIVSEDTVIAEFTVNNKQTHSQTLLPMIEQVVKFSGISLDELDAIAIAAGPGSFTGLRIGAATVKGLGLVTKKPVIPVPTLEGMAYQLAMTEGIICPMMDARRSQVYTGIFRMEQGRLVTCMEQCAMDVHELLERLKDYPEKIHFLGDGVPVYQSALEAFDGDYDLAPPHLSRQRGAAVALCGVRRFQENEVTSAAEFRPVYLRKSQAEREREERGLA